jgi:hypothetical protein
MILLFLPATWISSFFIVENDQGVRVKVDIVVAFSFFLSRLSVCFFFFFSLFFGLLSPMVFLLYVMHLTQVLSFMKTTIDQDTGKIRDKDLVEHQIHPFDRISGIIRLAG